MWLSRSSRHVKKAISWHGAVAGRGLFFGHFLHPIRCLGTGAVLPASDEPLRRPVQSIVLDGATVAGDIYVFTSPDDGVASSGVNRVQFWLDDPDRIGGPVHSERLAPYDFVGGSTDTAAPFDADGLADGSHTITAELPLDIGSSAVIHATFVIGSTFENLPPVLAPIAAQSVAEQQTLTIPVSASDPEGQPIVLSASGLPAFASFLDNGDGTGSLDLAPALGDAGDYAAVVSASDGDLLDLATVPINVAAAIGPPTIIQQPSDLSVVEGQPATFSVVAAGTQPIVYQWLWNQLDIDGENADSIALAATTADDDGDSYAVRVSNAQGSVLSSQAVLTVRSATTLIPDPANPRWLRYTDGSRFFLCGPGDPENFLYRGTRNPDGTRTGDQMDLIRKMTGTGANGIYFQIIRSHGGDGTWSHNPFIDSDPSQDLDQDILDQWETWFTAMDDAGIAIYAFFFDDSANIWGSGDAVPAAERDFLQRIVDRFEHHKSLIWVVAEEYQEAFSAERVSNMAAVIRAADDFGHPIAVHKLSGLSFSEFADDPNIDQFAIQRNDQSAPALHADMAAAFSDAAGRYNLNMAESAGHGSGSLARRKNWAIAMGGAYVMVYEWDIASTAVEDLRDCGRLVQFMESTDFTQMAPRDDLAFDGTQYTLADPPNSYILYASALAGQIGVRGIQSGQYDFRWYDIPTGTVVEQTGVAVTGGDVSWPSPQGVGAELAVFDPSRRAAAAEPAADGEPCRRTAVGRCAADGELRWQRLDRRRWQHRVPRLGFR